MEKREVKRIFDHELKLALVKQIEQGKTTVSAIVRIYGVSRTAVYKWLRKYSALYAKQTQVIVEGKSLSKKNKEQAERIKELERSLGQKQLRVDYLEKVLEVDSELDIPITDVLEWFRSRNREHSYTMQSLYQMIGISKQGHYKRVSGQKQLARKNSDVLAGDLALRSVHKRMGCRKIYHEINPAGMGRNKTEALLGSSGFRLKIRRSYHRTTYAGRRRYPNLISGLELSGVNQLWVSDITYIAVRTSKSFYLTLIMDVYSRKIKGWSLSATLLKMIR